MNKSSIAKTLRTSITDLDIGGDLSDEQLGQVAGGQSIIGQAVDKIINMVKNHKCWQASASITNPGVSDNAQDVVTDC